MILGQDPKHVSKLNINLSLILSLCLSPILSLSPSPDLSLCVSLRRSWSWYWSWSWFSCSFIVCCDLSLSIWGHLEASGSIWEHLGASGSIWEHLGASGSTWEHLEASGSIWEHLGVIWESSGSHLGVQRLHLGVIWRRTSEIAHFHCKNCDFHQNVEKAPRLLHFSLKSSDLAWSLRLKWSLYEVFLKVGFQKTQVFSAGGRHGTECNRARQIEFSYHIEVRTLNARRMFREKQQVEATQLTNHLWLEATDISKLRQPLQHYN